MIEILKQLRVLAVQSGKSYQTIAEHTDYAKSTINNILTGKSEEVKLQTIIDIAAELGAEVVLVTEQSKKAIAEQDISFYRDEIAKRDDTITALKAEIEKLTAAAERPDLFAALEEQRKLTEHYRLAYKDALEDKQDLRDQLHRKDRYIDILIETASKGGDLKAVKLKASEAE